MPPPNTPASQLAALKTANTKAKSQIKKVLAQRNRAQGKHRSTARKLSFAKKQVKSSQVAKANATRLLNNHEMVAHVSRDYDQVYDTEVNQHRPHGPPTQRRLAKSAVVSLRGAFSGKVPQVQLQQAINDWVDSKFGCHPDTWTPAMLNSIKNARRSSRLAHGI
jgi:hypothetical protein